jgi:tRNA threonylcarbamoyladenosine biosynthesis protein TsaB
MNTLKIDTTDNKKIIINLKVDGNEYKKEQDFEKNSTQAVLPMIVELLKENDVTIKDIQAIEVNRGPGSYTGVRVGLAIANALSFALSIPVNGKRSFVVDPIY